MAGFQRICTLILILVCLLGPVLPAAAQENGQVQIFNQRLENGQIDYYILPDLQTGQTVFVYVKNTDGNLDPFAALLRPETNLVSLGEQIREQTQQAIDEGSDPLQVLPGILNTLAEVWDDDSGGGYSVAFQFTVARPGDYRLMVTSALQQASFGAYQLTVGIDAPQVLSGGAVSTGDTVALLDKELSNKNSGVQKFPVLLSSEQPVYALPFNVINQDDVIYVRAFTENGDLNPTLILRDFGGKAQATANLNGALAETQLQYRAPRQATGYSLEISACCSPPPGSEATIQVTVGVNDPDVLTGTAAPGGRQVLQLPIPVKVGLRLQQISNVDQLGENFSMVATMRMEWSDPALAYDPADCNCQYKIYQDTNFNDFLKASNNRWPSFTFFNQQGNRWTQNRLVSVQPDGKATYLERFWSTFQAPDFDFRQFPFDEQTFYLRMDNIYPETYFTFTNDDQFTGIGEQLGEEEWYILNGFTETSTETMSSSMPVSRISFGIVVTRHLDYYIFRIFVPVVLIILVSWFTFFLKNYSKRVDVASANVLLFIAYNFTIANDLPRLGYLTFLDTVLISAFVISVGVVLYNVILVRLEDGKLKDRFLKIDSILIWAYPLLYLGTFIVLVLRVI
jgi:hypothetical protein